MRRGARGDNVRALQDQLRAAGFDPGASDGVFGPKTDKAVRDFQAARGLQVDGIAGPQTMGSLGGGGGAAPADTSKADQLAQEYGWASATIAAIPDIKALFDRAVAENWEPEKFQMEVRNTGWFKANGEAARSAIALKTTDPATWNTQVTNFTETINAKATQMGATLTPAEVMKLSESYFMFGWNDANLTNAMSAYIKSTNGTMYGAAGAALTQYREFAADMGINVSDRTLEAYATQTASGDKTSDTVLSLMRQTAVSTWPQFKDRILAGETVAQIADPYVQQMSKTLELNPEQVTLADRTIRGALSAKDKDGKPTMRSVWEFEQDLRKDARWRKTQGAQDEAGAIINSLGTMFGKVAG